jgi:tyrosyl-tRNA synthetase
VRLTARGLFETKEFIAAGLPTTDVTRQEARQGISVVDLLHRSGLAASKGEARRLIRGGGARLNDAKIDDENMVVTSDQLVQGRLLLSAGKKRHALVRLA